MKKRIFILLILSSFSLINCMSLENLRQQAIDFLRKNQKTIAVAAGLLTFNYFPSKRTREELRNSFRSNTLSTLTLDQYCYIPNARGYDIVPYPVSRLTSSVPNNNPTKVMLLIYAMKLAAGISVYEILNNIKF